MMHCRDLGFIRPSLAQKEKVSGGRLWTITTESPAATGKGEERVRPFPIWEIDSVCRVLRRLCQALKYSCAVLQTEDLANA
jgi:hypothetical protein